MYLRIPLGTTLIRAGHIQPWRDFAARSKRVLPPKFPVLSSPGMFINPREIGEGFGFGTGTTKCDGVTFVTIRVQLADRQYYWLADPHDTRVWKMFDAWNEQGECLLALSVEGNADYGVVGLPNDDPRFGQVVKERVRGLREVPYSEFTTAALKLMLSGSLEATATTDMPSIPTLSRVDVCLLSSTKVETGIRKAQQDGTFDRLLARAGHLH